MFLKAVPYKELLVRFIKDQTSVIGVFFINTALIIMFYFFSTDGQVSIAYPIILSLFTFVCYGIWVGFRYVQFHQKIQDAKVDPHYDVSADTYEHQEMLKALRQLHKHYMERLSTLQEENTVNNRFLYQWIHETKTPVSVIHLILQKLDERFPDDQVFIHDIRQENNKILDNLDKALNMVRLKEFAKDYQPEPVSLSKLLKDVINNHKKQFIYHNVFPVIEGNPDNSCILSDKKWYRFMLEQLISNGIKYSTTKNQSKNLYFNIKQDHTHTYLYVKDEGIGIPPYDLPRIYQPFFTGENGRHHKNATGMGLYLCHMIANKLNHQLTIQSTQGKGTTVEIKCLTKNNENTL
ncbi:sensor histidine kinase [Vallitalea pronyensis]|uniref:histidine kinase n=1 Tax=Vallitalea pronyensis TaxID=1348613 RepID=A0A8J8MGI3_9FIRM|nr:sensor histidine kinase [Vallitalea pronyensis]QUI21126.1 sensor histidine kinase [Vallitalea pronyensis]